MDQEYMQLHVYYIHVLAVALDSSLTETYLILLVPSWEQEYCSTCFREKESEVEHDKVPAQSPYGDNEVCAQLPFTRVCALDL